MAEKDEKETTRTRVGVGNTAIERETQSRSSEQDDRDRYRGTSASASTGAAGSDDRYEAGYRDNDRGYRDDAGYRDEYEEDDDYDVRARRDVADLGDSVRETSRRARRASTDILSSGCDLLSNLCFGFGDALSPRGRSSGSSRSSSLCRGVNRNDSEDDDDRYESSRPRYSSEKSTYRAGTGSSGGSSTGTGTGAGASRSRTTSSRTEVRRTTSK